MGQSCHSWWNWINVTKFSDGTCYSMIGEWHWGYYFITTLKCLLAFIIFSDFIYTLVKVYTGSKSKFSYSLMPFTLFYSAFLVLSLVYWN